MRNIKDMKGTLRKDEKELFLNIPLIFLLWDLATLFSYPNRGGNKWNIEH